MPQEYLVTGEPQRVPAHPGAILRLDVLPALGLTVSRAARELGVSRQTLHRIMAGTHPVTIEMALRLGKFCGNGAEIWIRMQQAHDLWHAQRRMKRELEKIPAHG